MQPQSKTASDADGLDRRATTAPLDRHTVRVFYPRLEQGQACRRTIVEQPSNHRNVGAAVKVRKSPTVRNYTQF